MTSLVTGACGFLGGHVCEILVQAGHVVRATDRASFCGADDPRAGIFPSVVRGLGLEPVPASGGDVPLDGITTVFHAGLLTDPGATLAELERVNAGETAALCGAATAAGVEQLVLFSASDIYGTGRPGLLDERAAPAPESEVGRSLLLAEQAALRSTGLSVYVLRPAGVYGPRAATERGWGGRLVRLARLAVAAAPANLARPVSLIHVRDVARAAIHLVTGDAEPGVYNVTSEDELTERELVRRVALLTGRPFLDLPPLPLQGLHGAVRAAGRLSDHLARWRGGPALGPPGLADLLGRGEPRVDTARLSATGFQLEFPEASRGVRDTLTWYKQEGWL